MLCAVFCRFETFLEDLHERHDELAYETELGSLQELSVGLRIFVADSHGTHGGFAFPASTDDGTYLTRESTKNTLFNFTHSFTFFLGNFEVTWLIIVLVSDFRNRMQKYEEFWCYGEKWSLWCFVVLCSALWCFVGL